MGLTQLVFNLLTPQLLQGPAFVPTGIFKPAFFVTLDLDDPQGEELA